MQEVAIRKLMPMLGVQNVYKSRYWINGSCPLAKWTHAKKKDSHPSFGIMINEAGESFYKCLGCKHSGSVFSLVNLISQFSGKNMLQLMAFVSDAEDDIDLDDFMAHTTEVEEDLEALSEEAYSDLFEPAWSVKESRMYLKGRGISKGTAEKLELGFDDNQKRVIFPVRGIDGELYGFTGRSILRPETYPYDRYPKIRDYAGLPKRRLLLGEHLFNAHKPVLIVEGLFAYAHLIEIQANKYFNISAIMGSEMTLEKAAKLIKFNRAVYLLFDNDQAGDDGLFGKRLKNGEHKGNGAIDRLIKYVPVYVPDWPDGKEDPDELNLREVKSLLDCEPYMED